jgi:GTP:adenosylcobinamide-phosphate guanylyltransferase
MSEAPANGRTAVLILAGGRITPEMAAVAPGTTNRALIRLNGHAMLDYVVAAIRGGVNLSDTERLILAGDDLPAHYGGTRIPGGTSLVDTLLNAVAELTPQETRLLVFTADIPFLTAEAVSDFVRRASALGGAQFIYPIVDAAASRSMFPEMKRTTLRVAEGEFTGGNVVLLDPAFLRANEALLRHAYAQRKSVVGLARLLGPGTLVRLVASRALPKVLPIPYLEETVGRALGGATARAVVSPYPEIGADVDRPEDVAVAERILASRTSDTMGTNDRPE